MGLVYEGNMGAVVLCKLLIVSSAGFELWLQQKGLRCELCALCERLSEGTASHLLPSGDTLVLRGEFRGVKLIVKIM